MMMLFLLLLLLLLLSSFHDIYGRFLEGARHAAAGREPQMDQHSSRMHNGLSEKIDTLFNRVSTV
jgi:hypothetical protein